MEQKTKLSILALLLIVFIVGSIYLIQNKKNASVKSPTSTVPATVPETQTLPTALNPSQELPEVADAKTKAESVGEISGKVNSIGEKAVYIEVADGKSFTANINPQTPVIIQGVNKPGSLADLKADQNVTLKVDNENNALQILIKK